MAGHRRPHGVPICPTPDLPPTPVSARRQLRRRDNDAQSNLPQTGHRRNPNWVDPERASVIDDGDIIPRGPSWVSTEPASDEEWEGIQTVDDEQSFWGVDDNDDDDDGEDDDNASSHSDKSKSSSTSVKSTLSQAMFNTEPLVSLFRSPVKDVPFIARAARRNKMSVGVMDHDAHNLCFKCEDTHAIVAMGRDGAAVLHLVDLHKREAKRRQQEMPCSCVCHGPKVGAYPVDPRWIKNTFFDRVIASIIGGLIVLYGLSIM